MWEQVHASVILLIFTNALSFTESTSIDFPHWVKYNPDKGSLPDDAIVGGYGGNENETLYIARAPHAGSLTPGKYVPSTHQTIIPWGGISHIKNYSEILCGLGYEWFPTTTQNISDGAFIGGYVERTHEPLYVGRTEYLGEMIPGKVARSEGVMYIAYRDKEIQVKNFEILLGLRRTKPKIIGESKIATTIGQTVKITCRVLDGNPSPTISWQFRSITSSRFLSIPKYDKILHISKVDATDAGTYKCVATNEVGKDEHLTTLFVQNNATNLNLNLHWVSFNPDTDELPADAIVGGYQNETLYIARAPHEGSLTPGMYVPSTHKAYVTWSTDAHAKTVFEILCGRDYKWVPTTTEYIPDGAVVGGYIENSYETEYIGRTNYSGYVIPGKVAVSYGVLYFAYEGRTTAVRNFEILVEVKKVTPRIIGKLRRKVIEGHSVNIECEVLEGIPKPTISWEFKAKDDSSFVSIPGSDNVLRLSNVYAANAGTFKCIATNYVGQHQHFTELIVSKIIAVPHWVSFDPATDVLPPDAIVGGYQNETLYIARAPHEGSLSPGMYVPSTHKAYVTWSSEAHSKTVLEILCGRNHEWVPTTTDFIPQGAVIGGYVENSNETEYIGRTNYSGYIIPGKVHVSHGVLYFAYEGRTTSVRNFEILIEAQTRKKSPLITGRGRKMALPGESVEIECEMLGIPKPTVSWQFKAKNESTFISLPGSDNMLRLSNVNTTNAGTYKCVATNDVGDDEHFIELMVSTGVIDPYLLSFDPDVDALPKNAIVGGYENETLYIAVAPHEESIIPGMYVPSVHKAYVTKDNDVYPKKKIQILCGDNYIWVPTNTDYFPDGAYRGGYIRNSYWYQEHLYVCRANYSGHVIPGVVAVSQGACHIAYGGNIIPVRNFEVITVPDKRGARITGKDRETVVEGHSVNIVCTVTDGSPEPTISWEFREKYGLKFVPVPGTDNVLLISRADETDAGTYRCTGSNDSGYDMQRTDLIVQTIIDDYGIIHEVDLFRHMQGSSSRLRCGSGDTSQQISWYNNGLPTETIGETYVLRNLDMSFEGHNYTCRVTDGNITEVHTFVLTVNPLQFVLERRDSIFLDLTDIEGFELNCDFVSIASANISWTFNGELMDNQNSSRFTFDGKGGNYTCKVTSIHGTIQRHFYVTSSISECQIPRKQKNEYINITPLISNVTAMSADYRDSMKVQSGQKLVFSCPDFEHETNHFQMFPLRNKIKVQCVKGDQFIVKDKVYKLTDLVCAKEVKTEVFKKHQRYSAPEFKIEVLKKHQRCWPNNNNSELMEVGFIETFEVCFDTTYNIPLYIPGKISKNNPSCFAHNYPGLEAHLGADTCDNATSTCCYTKSQLVNTCDFGVVGPLQRKTDIDPLNAVIIWRPCDLPQPPWEVMELSVRMMTAFKDEFKVWSGTYMPQNKNGTIIPRYLWKALEKALVLIFINGPSPSKEDILCTNLCGESPPWPAAYKKHIYCCDLEDFLVRFGLEATNVGEPLPGGSLFKARALF